MYISFSKHLILIALILSTIIHCSSNKKALEPQQLSELVAGQIGLENTCLINEDETCKLCIGNGRSKSNPLDISFVVVDIYGAVLVEKTVIHGKVSWSDNTNLLVQKYPRVRNQDGSTSVETSYIPIIFKEK